MQKQSFRSKVYKSCSILWIIASVTLNGCAGFVAGSGPSTKDILKAPGAQPNQGIQVIDVTSVVASKLAANEKRSLFSEVFNNDCHSENVIGPGDVLEVTI